VAAVLTGALMLEQLGHPQPAAMLEQAVRAALVTARTPDLGGSATTQEVADAIYSALS
jgi:isocitrate/isopropylmalate dehydrogenase